MSTSLYYSYYPKECNHPSVLPFLYEGDDNWYHGNHMPEGFYDACYKYGKWDEISSGWVFDNVVDLFEFAADSRVPGRMSNYITKVQYLDINDDIPHKEDDVFIVWKR